MTNIDDWAAERPLNFDNALVRELRQFLATEFKSQHELQMLMDEIGLGNNVTPLGQGVSPIAIWHANLRTIWMHSKTRKFVDILIKYHHLPSKFKKPDQE